MKDADILKALKEGRVQEVIEWLEKQQEFENQLSDYYKDSWPDFVDGDIA